MSYGDSVLVVFLLYIFVVDVYASLGDRSLSFRKCLFLCQDDCPFKGSGNGMLRNVNEEYVKYRLQ